MHKNESIFFGSSKSYLLPCLEITVVLGNNNFIRSNILLVYTQIITVIKTIHTLQNFVKNILDSINMFV